MSVKTVTFKCPQCERELTGTLMNGKIAVPTHVVYRGDCHSSKCFLSGKPVLLTNVKLVTR